MEFPKDQQVVSAGYPVNITGAGLTSKRFDLSLYRRVMIILQAGAWAGGTSAVTLLQGTVAWGANKALAFTKRMKCSDPTASDALAEVAVVANTFNIAAANELNIITIDAEDLDATNGYKLVEVVCATPGANADLLGIIMIGDRNRYRQYPPEVDH